MRERPRPLGSGRTGPLTLVARTNFVAAGEIADGAPQHGFAFAAGIDIGGVKEIDTQFQGALDEGTTLFFVQSPGPTEHARPRSDFGFAIAHAAEAKARDPQAGVSEVHVIHISHRLLCPRAV